MSCFWKSLYEALNTRLNFSITYHPQSNGKSEKVIQILEDMLQGCSSIQMAPYEALYGLRCRTLLCQIDLGEKKVFELDLVQKTKNNVKII
ncbi:Retrotransposon protein, Ty3-gypsy subclass [Gossypium australe]|uniref:Retrotransposon protein, Ty3-gypsy subclass n=1 Tax=Gossypium australe TaxID=47621 RepID=A0A5B6VXN2_9ROSI|nr:Retrotransposon protein, Ty3-gypsy subclass [Gossypium australe]